MITEERIAEALDCFKKPGTDEQRREAAAAVLSEAMRDYPTTDEFQNRKNRLTIAESLLLASLVEGNVNRIILDAATLKDFWEEIKDANHDEVESVKKLHEFTMLPFGSCSALHDKLHSVSDEVRTGLDEFYNKRILEIQRKHEAEIAHMQRLWQMERDMVLAWKKRTERLRRSLVRMAESPQYCDECGANALGPEPRLDEEVPF